MNNNPGGVKMKHKINNSLNYEKFGFLILNPEILKSELKKSISLKCNSSIELLDFVYNSISEVRKLIMCNEKETAVRKLFFLSSQLKNFDKI